LFYLGEQILTVFFTWANSESPFLQHFSTRDSNPTLVSWRLRLSVLNWNSEEKYKKCRGEKKCGTANYSNIDKILSYL
jgi:hypothetical protein